MLSFPISPRSLEWFEKPTTTSTPKWTSFCSTADLDWFNSSFLLRFLLRYNRGSSQLLSFKSLVAYQCQLQRKFSVDFQQFFHIQNSKQVAHFHVVWHGVVRCGVVFALFCLFQGWLKGSTPHVYLQIHLSIGVAVVVAAAIFVARLYFCSYNNATAIALDTDQPTNRPFPILPCPKSLPLVLAIFEESTWLGWLLQDTFNANVYLGKRALRAQ